MRSSLARDAQYKAPQLPSQRLTSCARDPPAAVAAAPSAPVATPPTDAGAAAIAVRYRVEVESAPGAGFDNPNRPPALIGMYATRRGPDAVVAGRREARPGVTQATRIIEEPAPSLP